MSKKCDRTVPWYSSAKTPDQRTSIENLFVMTWRSESLSLVEDAAITKAWVDYCDLLDRVSELESKVAECQKTSG